MYHCDVAFIQEIESKVWKKYGHHSTEGSVMDQKLQSKLPYL